MTNPATGPVLVAADTGAVLGAHPEAETLLNGDERARAGTLRSAADRDDFVAARLLARRCVAALLGVDGRAVRIEQHCPGCGGRHGPARVAGRPDVGLSWSHTRGYVAAVAGFGPVGVDVELTRHDRIADEVAGLVLTEGERRVVALSGSPARCILRQWVRKEAMVKAGLASLDRLGELDLAHLPVDITDHHMGRFGDWYVLDWSDPGAGAFGTFVSRQPSARRSCPS